MTTERPCLEPYLTFAGLGTQDAEQDEGLFVTMAAASVTEDGGGAGGGEGEASDEEDSSDEDEEDTPERVQNAARLLASLVSADGGGGSGGALDPDHPASLPSRLLSAHCCHGCFSAAQIGSLVDAAERHVAIHGWLTKRHSQHPTTDFSLHDAPLAWSAAEPTVSGVVLPTLHRLYFGGGGANGSGGATLTINDLFYVRYDGDTAGAQRELEAHRDGSLLSFSIALTEPSSFAGGGTRFVGDGRVLRPERAGDLVAHSGKVGVYFYSLTMASAFSYFF